MLKKKLITPLTTPPTHYNIYNLKLINQKTLQPQKNTLHLHLN